MLKKINAYASFLTALLTLIHVVAVGLSRFGVPLPSMIPAATGGMTMVFFILHVLLSIIILFFMSGDGITYPALNKPTMIQRATAIILILLVHFHVGGHSGSMSVFNLITELLFFYFILSHFMCSLEKGLTTLGISNKAIQIPIRMLSVLGFLFAIVSTVYAFFAA